MEVVAVAALLSWPVPCWEAWGVGEAVAASVEVEVEVVSVVVAHRAIGE